MKYLKLYENFEDIKQICQRYFLENYTINQDGTVDVDRHVTLQSNGLTKLPLKFGKVNGYFNCNFNKLITLEGSPTEVTRYFLCTNNKLITLIGGPKQVGGSYYCEYNHLKDVHGFPEYFYNNIYIKENPVSEIINLVISINEEKFVKYLNEYDVIRDGCKIVEQRLEEAYWMATKLELPSDRRRFKNYQLI